MRPLGVGRRTTGGVDCELCMKVKVEEVGLISLAFQPCGLFEDNANDLTRTSFNIINSPSVISPSNSYEDISK